MLKLTALRCGVEWAHARCVLLPEVDSSCNDRHHFLLCVSDKDREER